MRDWVDEKLAAALFDVPVPEGLCERLLGRLQTPEIKPRPAVAVRGATGGRSFVLAAGVLAAIAAGLLVTVWIGMQRGEELSEQFVLDEAIRWFDLGGDQPGRLLAERPAPSEYPFSPAVLQVRGSRWRRLEQGAFLGGRCGVIYDLPGPAGTTAALYVVDGGALAEFCEAPALHPFTTAGCCASAWQEGGLLYVLVVQGDPATYRAYLNLPRGPVA